MAIDPEKEAGMMRRLRGLLDDDVPTKEEFLEAFEQVVKYVQGIDSRLSGDFDALSKAITGMGDGLKTENSTSLTEMKGMIDELFVGDRLEEIRAGLQEIIDAKLAQVRDGRDGVDADENRVAEIVKQSIRVPKDGSPDTPADIVSKLESLEEEERLDASAIKNLDRFVQDHAPKYFPAGVGGGNAVFFKDLSGSLDGVTRTFAMPSFWRIILVNLSSFPNVLRETVDYTFDASAMTITFTSEVPDNSLASGQTLIVVYAGTA